MSQIISFHAGSPLNPSIDFIQGNLPLATPVGPNPATGIVNVVGTGSVTVTGTPGTFTQTISVTGGGLVWELIPVVGPTPLVANHGYIVTVAGLAQCTLPATSAIGEIIEIIMLDESAGSGYEIAKGIGNTFYSSAKSAATVTYLNQFSGAPPASVATDLHGSIRIISIAANTWSIVNETGTHQAV